MRILIRFVRTSLLISFAFLVSYCDEDTAPTMSLPTGCQTQGVNAIAVLEEDVRCSVTNAFRDGEEALGPPDGRMTGEGKLEFDGFVSLGVDGSVTLYAGSCIQDLAGPDVRVFQTVSNEAVEVQVSSEQSGPFVSLGTQACDDFCDFDLAGSGLNNVRVVKVIDQGHTQFPIGACDNVGPSPGADLDAIQVLH